MNATESPSSRPMTLRQQLQHIVARKFLADNLTSGVDMVDELVGLCERYSQEIAREARLDELRHLLIGRTPSHQLDFILERIEELTQKPPQPLPDMQDTEEAQSE
jgi:hypothetical protein